MKKRELAVWFVMLFALGVLALPLAAQINTPWVIVKGEPDTRDLGKVARAVFEKAGATTDRQKAEALWSYLLTDGRFVEPGMFYHIAGWAYEEPRGEVLDPVKLLNSYGFGLCYQDGPLIEALFEAGGFQDARSWFLTGHTVCEVFYDGRYGMLDCDMLGYTTLGGGDPRTAPIASVHELESDRNIIMGKLLAPDKVDSSKVVYPWYPADVRARAMGGYAETFTSAGDNWLYPFQRYSGGHEMDYVLRPGEKLIRNDQPETHSLYYLPYKHTGGQWSEFPREIEEYDIKTEDGPHSQKDERRWGTGTQIYTPPLHREAAYYPSGNANLRLPSSGGGALERQDEFKPATAVFAMPSAWVLIDSRIRLYAELSNASNQLLVETSTDGGVTWCPAGALRGPHAGPFDCAPEVLTVSEHGTRNAVSGSYGYLVRLTLAGPGGRAAARDIVLTSRFQLNPRSLPRLTSGENELLYSPGGANSRVELPVVLNRVGDFAVKVENLVYEEENSNGLLHPAGMKQGAAVFALSLPGGGEMGAISAGGRFLKLDGVAPEKTTAETRTTKLRSPKNAGGSLEWSLAPDGPWKSLWSYSPPEKWLDGKRETRLLLWPEVDRTAELPAGTTKAYVRYSLNGLALDDIRLAVRPAGQATGGRLVVTHRWMSRSSERSQSIVLDNPAAETSYKVLTGPGDVTNLSLEFECPVE